MDFMNIGGDSSDQYYRYRMPKLETSFENKNGGTTVIKNIDLIAEKLGRSVKLISKFISKSIGCSAKVKKGKGLLIIGKWDDNKLNSLIQDYINKFVLCPGCGNPETDWIEKKKSITLNCRACGKITKL